MVKKLPRKKGASRTIKPKHRVKGEKKRFRHWSSNIIKNRECWGIVRELDREDTQKPGRK